MAAFRTLCRQTGFSLTELLIVVAIIGIVAAGAIMAVSPVPEVHLQGTSNHVMQALRFAQNHAMNNGSMTNVEFDTKSMTVHVYEPVFSSPFSSTFTKKPVMHPLQKKEYLLKLEPLPLSGTNIGLQVNLKYNDGSFPLVSFNKDGKPGRAVGDKTMRQIQTVGNWRGYWQPNGMKYEIGDWVLHDGVEYNCLQGHNSGTDFAMNASRWAVRTEPGQIILTTGRHSRHISLEDKTGIPREHTR